MKKVKKTLVVCQLKGEKSPFLDNETGVCYRCKDEVQYRPYRPVNTELICVACVAKYFESKTMRFSILPETIKEIGKMRLN